jgi:hypothetical protein
MSDFEDQIVASRYSSKPIKNGFETESLLPYLFFTARRIHSKLSRVLPTSLDVCRRSWKFADITSLCTKMKALPASFRQNQANQNHCPLLYLGDLFRKCRVCRRSRFRTSAARLSWPIDVGCSDNGARCSRCRARRRLAPPEHV